GYGFAPVVNVAALETGKILELPVGLHDLVDPDEIVVKMDPQPLIEERELANANLLAVQEDQARQAMSDARRFAEGAENSLVNRAQMSAQLQEDQALLTTLNERLSLERDLASTGASSNQAVEEWKRQITVVEARLSAARHAFGIASDAANSAKSRNAAVPAMNEWSVVAASRALEMIEGRIARFDLKAGIHGQVQWIYRQPGEVVPAGEPILQVRQVGTKDVVAFMAPSEVAGLEAGESASIRRQSGQVVHGKLVSVGSGPQPMPIQLWRMPSWPEYGVPVRVVLDSEIAPDEAVTVRL
ncbi:MAG: HlyD family efflux transporter periplasmic adaptor subunit, partial [Myxococcota bacterium]